MVVALFASGAGAHADIPLVDGRVRVEPGVAYELPMSLHFHRLVGRYRVEGDGAPALALYVVRGHPELGASGTGDVHPPPAADVLVGMPLGDEGAINRLVPCCLGEAYADLSLVVRHDGAEPVGLDLRVWAVHDEFAVVARRAEPGALEVPLVLFLALGAAVLATTNRVLRRAPGEAREPDRWRFALRVSGTLWAVACAAGGALALVGVVRYGGGPIAGTLAVLADLDVPGGPFGSRAATLLGVLLLAWCTGIASWSVAVGRGAHRASPWAVHLGTAFVLASAATGLAMAWTYDGAWVPLLLAAVLAVPLGLASLRLGRDRTAMAPPPATG